MTAPIQLALTPEEWLSPRVMFRPSKSVPEVEPDFDAAGAAKGDYAAYYRHPWPQPVRERKNPDGSTMMRKVDEGYGIEKEPIGAGWCWVFDGSWSVTLGNETRHKLAALALHGQPFGFDSHAVRALRYAANVLMRKDGDEYESAVLSVTADRIEALLPPEAE